MGGPDPTVQGVLEFVGGFKLSKLVYTMVSVGVFDALDKYGPMKVAEVAAKLPEPIPAPYDGLRRMMKFCACLQLLTIKDDVFDLPPASKKYLCSSSPTSLAAFIDRMDKVVYDLTDDLEKAVRSGSPNWSGDSKEKYANEYVDAASTLRFLKSMDGLANIWAPALLPHFNLKKYKEVVDLGGGSGAVSAALIKSYPHLTATVVDLPAAVEAAKANFCANLRVSWSAADFFTQPVPSGDLYVVANVLQDWEDHQASSVLRVAYENLAKGGSILVCEACVTEDGTGPFFTSMLDTMLTVTSKGKQRTVKEITALLESAGFINVEVQGPAAYHYGFLASKPF